MSDDPIDLDLAKRHLQVAYAYVSTAFPDGIRSVDQDGGATVYRLVRFDVPRLIAEVEALRTANGQLDLAVKARNAGLRDMGELAEFRRRRIEELERGRPAQAGTDIPVDAALEQKIRRSICREEGCKLVESTRMGEADREFQCVRCGETRTKPRAEAS